MKQLILFQDGTGRTFALEHQMNLKGGTPLFIMNSGVTDIAAGEDYIKRIREKELSAKGLDPHSSCPHAMDDEAALRKKLKSLVADVNYLISVAQDRNLGMSVGVDRHGRLFGQQLQRMR